MATSSSPDKKQGTPHTYRFSVSGLSYRSQEQQRRFANDIEWKIVGPMPPEEFLDQFFPSPSNTETELRKELKKRAKSRKGDPYDKIKFAGVPNSPKQEEAIYEGLCHDLNVIAELRDLTFCNTSRRTENPGELGAVKPDIGLFHTKDKDKGYLFNFRKGGRNQSSSYVARMGLVYMFVEIKKSPAQDIFTDPPLKPDSSPNYPFTIDTQSRRKDDQDRISALGQNAHYAHVVQTLQFRTCVFSLTISGKTARILRWDRSGVLVTRSFDYKASPKTLIDFVWRFVNATPIQQGFDTTANSADSSDDSDAFREAIASHVQLQLALDPKIHAKELEEEVNRHLAPDVLTRLTIGGFDFWVSRPLWASHAIVGRCTVGYWGVRCDTKDVVFVKDVWRTSLNEIDQEGDILSQLGEKGVGKIPTVVCHGDVIAEGVPQTTCTDLLTDEDWVMSLNPGEPYLRKFVSRTHYRLVTNVAGYPLSTFKGSRELLKGTYDCFIVVMEAHEKAETIHRDVGLPNMILYRPKEGEERVGYLIDWELACKLDKGIARDHVLTGTPAFMSINTLDVLNHTHTLEDDLESFIYTVLYASLRWLPLESPIRLSWWLTDFFGSPDHIGLGGGGDRKMVNAQRRTYTRRISDVGNMQVLRWLNDAMDLHYKDGVPNPVWVGGEALKKMWGEYLSEVFVLDDRHENPIDDMDIREGPPNVLDATHSVTTSRMKIYEPPAESTKPTKRKAKTNPAESTKPTKRKAKTNPAESTKPTKRRAKTDSGIPRSPKGLRSGKRY